MAFKSLAGLVFLLASVGVQLSPALAAEGPAVGVSKAGRAAQSGVAGKVEANWDRDLFAIFREGAEPDEEETADSEPDWEIVPPEAEPEEAGREPVGGLPELKLQGIVMADDRAAALVDGKIVRPGEEIKGWTVSRITRHGLLVVGPEGEKEYQLLAGGGRAQVSSQAVTAPE